MKYDTVEIGRNDDGTFSIEAKCCENGSEYSATAQTEADATKKATELLSKTVEGMEPSDEMEDSGDEYDMEKELGRNIDNAKKKNRKGGFALIIKGDGKDDAEM
jgi:hypothetical protein